MTSHDFRPGEVIIYPYLWAWQQQERETEGRKQRPVCVVVAVPSARDDNTHLALLAISTQPPAAERAALEIPDIECRRAGLGDLKQSWIVVDEYNYDIVERSWYIEPGQAVLGRFSKSFMMKVAAAFTEARARDSRVNRID